MTTSKSTLCGSTAGTLTHIVQLGDCPGELVEGSEPLSPLTLTAGLGREPYREILASISSNPGAYILIGEEQGGGHAAYVGEAGNVLAIRRTRSILKKMNLIWFAVVSSPWPFLSRAQARGLAADIYRLHESMDGMRLLGTVPSVVPISTTDALLVDSALATARRLLTHAGFALGDNIDPKDECEAGTASPPRTYKTYRYCPGEGTSGADLHAVGSDIDGGFLLLPGSEYRPENCDKLAHSIMDRRKRLANGGYLEPIFGVTARLRLKRSITMSTALVAAKVFSGHAVNDPGVWRPLECMPAAVA